MVRTGVRRICERGLLGFAFWASPAAAQSTPTVTGPTGDAGIRVPELPGPTTHDLSHALRVNFEGQCISSRSLVGDVERWLGDDRVDDRISIEVSGAEQPLRAHFWLLVEDERRALRRFEDFSGTCQELSKSLAAAIALAIEAAELPARKPTLPPVVRKPQPWTPPLRRRRPKPTADSAPVVRSFQLRAHGAFAIGATYGAGWGGGLRAELGLPAQTSVRAGGHYVGGAEEPLAEGTVGSRALGGEFGACWGSLGGGVSGRLCMDLWVGTLEVQGRDLSRAREDSLTTLNVVPGAELRLSGGDGPGVYLGAYGLVNLSRPRVEVRMNTRDQVLAQLQLPPLGFLVALGADWMWL